MSRHLPLPCMAVLSTMAALTASAQSAPQAATANQAAQASQAQAAPYRSAFESYQPFTDQKIVPWRQANDTVGKIGGWRAYAREAHEAAGKGDKAPAESSATPTPPKADKARP
jgi:hypothetical protein